MNLTDAQKATLKTHILASANADVIAARTIRNDVELARLYNLNSSFIVYKTSVTLNAIGLAFEYTGVAALTSANNERLNVFANYNPVSADPRRSDVRQFFEDVFSVAAGATTRANLIALWKRPATVAESVFTTGTGSDAVPGALVVEGTISVSEISAVMNLP
jgi:hypothetical protein